MDEHDCEESIVREINGHRIQRWWHPSDDFDKCNRCGLTEGTGDLDSWMQIECIPREDPPFQTDEDIPF